MKDKVYRNKGQFLVLLFLCMILFADKFPVLYDKLNHIESYRLHDGFRDAIIDVLYFIVSLIVLLTIKVQDSKRDFIVVLCFTIGLVICIPLLGIVRFVIISMVAVGLFLYIISSLLKNLNSNATN